MDAIRRMCGLPFMHDLTGFGSQLTMVRFETISFVLLLRWNQEDQAHGHHHWLFPEGKPQPCFKTFQCWLIQYCTSLIVILHDITIFYSSYLSSFSYIFGRFFLDCVWLLSVNTRFRAHIDAHSRWQQRSFSYADRDGVRWICLISFHTARYILKLHQNQFHFRLLIKIS